MQKYFLIFILLGALSAHSQESSLELNGDIGLFNTSINAKLLSESYGFLDTQEKYNIIGALQEENELAFEANNSLRYQNKNGWGLSLSNHIGSYATYPKTLVQLSLLGNAPFKGDSLKLDPLRLTAFNYSQINFSYKWSRTIETSIGVLFGHQLLRLNTNDACFYTDDNAEFINYQLDFEAHYSDTSSALNNPFKSNGYGATFGISYKDSINNGNIEVSLSDIGFIRWNEKTTNMHIESQYNFEGINVDDFISFNDSILSNERDSVSDQLKTNLKESYIWRLPSRIRMSINQPLNFSIAKAYTLAIEHRMYLYKYPRLSLDINNNIKNHHFAFGYHVGGIEKGGFQLAYLYKGKKTQFKLFTKQANAVVPSQNYGLHIGFGIKRVFSSSK